MSLSVSEALSRRRSTRAFLDIPVPGAVVRDILEAAARTASSSNMQPWRIAAMTGADLDAFKAAVRRSLWENPRGEGAEYKIYADDLKEPYDRRRRQVAADMYATVGVAHGDKPGRLMHFARNFDFFGAPVGMILSLDRSHPAGQWADVGMFLQSLMLLAEERDLATCAQAAWAVMPRTIRAHLRLPEEQIVYCGVALGHADPSHPMNGLRTDRVSIDEFMDLRGFESDEVADQRKGENDMPVTREWNISIDSPLGVQTATLMLTQDGERLIGTQASERETVAIEDGAIDGDALAWSASVSSPMPMKLAFTGKIADDAISGSVAAGAFGRFPFTGSRRTV